MLSTLSEAHTHGLFGEPNLSLTDQFRRVVKASDDRRRRREEWLAERRQQLRERTHANVIAKALKKQTFQCAARRSGDPSLAVWRRLQAKTHAESRKAGFIASRPSDPIRGRLPSISAIPVISQLKNTDSELFSWAEVQSEKTTQWYHQGKWYTPDALNKQLALERKIRETSAERTKNMKGFEKSMAAAQTAVQEALALRRKGVTFNPEFRVISTTKTLPKARQASIHEWKMSQLALHYAQRDRLKRCASVRVASFSEASTFALQSAPDDPMDTSDDMVEIDEINFQMPSVTDFNATPPDHLFNILKPFSLNLLYELKEHVKAEGKRTKTFVDNKKWEVLNEAIHENKKNGYQSGKNNRYGNTYNGANGDWNNDSNMSAEYQQFAPWKLQNGPDSRSRGRGHGRGRGNGNAGGRGAFNGPQNHGQNHGQSHGQNPTHQGGSNKWHANNPGNGIGHGHAGGPGHSHSHGHGNGNGFGGGNGHASGNGSGVVKHGKFNHRGGGRGGRGRGRGGNGRGR